MFNFSLFLLRMNKYYVSNVAPRYSKLQLRNKNAIAFNIAKS